MASPAREIILGAENAWQVNLLLEMLEEMLCWTLKFLQSLHNNRTRMIATVQLLATNSRDLTGFLTTVKGRKVFGKRGIAGTVEEPVFD